MKAGKRVILLWMAVLLSLSQGCGPSTPGSEGTGEIAGGIYCDENQNCECEESEQGLADISVMLFTDACTNAYLYRRIRTDAEGEFLFDDVPPGNYCLMPDLKTVCGGFVPTTSIQQDVQVAAGEHTTVKWFGYTQLGSESP
jgi:hypothetical protein